MTARRYILHVDMDAFYASVEQRDNPELCGKPVVVGGRSNRGVVAAASYEARRFGIRSAMPMRDAHRRCPDVICVAPRMPHYKAVSEEIFGIFRDFTPLVEGLSLDEAFLDVSDSIILFGSAEAIAVEIKKRIRNDCRLNASVGVAPNKLVAKIASDLEKPDGLVVIEPDQVQQVLNPLRVEVIPGIGKQTLAKLHRDGIVTIRDLAEAPSTVLDRLFGKFAERNRERARGIDQRPVVAKRSEKSISAEETFDTDLSDPGDLKRELLRLAERTATRLRAKNLLAGRVQVKIRAANFQTYTRQASLHPPADDTAVFYSNASRLLELWRREHPGTAVRLLGVGTAELLCRQQGDLFESPAENNRGALDRTADAIRERFGSLPVGRARTFKGDQIG